jgi:hypothetical protein
MSGAKVASAAWQEGKMTMARVICGVLAFGLLALASQAEAHAGKQGPIVVIDNKPVDPTAFPWLSKDGVKALTDLVAQLKSGSIHAFAFAAAPGGASSYFPATKTDFITIGDLARRAEQSCEYYNKGVPCFIVSIDGRDARDPEGDLPVQPRLLGDVPSVFDAARVPFLTALGRSGMAGYAEAARPRAMVVSPDGWGQWNSGKTVLDAVAKDETACKTHLATDKNDTCLLYAIDDQVVFASPGAPALTTGERTEGAPPRPIIVSNPNPVDPKAFPWLDAPGVAALTNDIAQLKSGALSAFVFVAGAKSGKGWINEQATKTDIASVEDLARVGLETCEYYNDGEPCYVLSVNGKDGRDSSGTLPVQPDFLDRLPRTFDAAQAPFVWNQDRHSLASYANYARPRALILSESGWWTWHTAATLLDAITQDQADCQKHLATDKDDDCLLYAVNDEVVFSPDDQ